ncbi:hypothetical protein ADM96_15645 [Burkholderia sp. ST111]|nr:hypothetical protein ADM96_15645 [Burkholderia sp. ST111]
MANEGGTKAILSIPVDSTAFDELVAKVQAHQKMLEEMPAAWRGHNQGAAEAGEHAETLSDNFEDAHKHMGKLSNVFDKFRRASSDSKMTGQSSFVGSFKRESGDAEKSWEKISKWTEKSEKNLSGIARLAIVSGARGGLFGAAAGAVGGLAAGIVGGTAAAANSLADQNATMRQLGLKPGEEKAFSTEYEKYGFGEETLRTAAEAKRDPKFAQPLNALGISNSDVNKLDTVQLAQLMAERAGPAFNEHNKNGMGAMWMKNIGLSNLISPAQAQQAGTYGQSDFAKTREEFTELVPKLALAQDAYDKGTEALKKFTAALQEDETSLLAVFTPLLDPLSKLAKELSDAVAAFVRSGELQKDMDDVVDGFGKLADFLKQLHLINDNKDNDSVGAGVDAVTKSGYETGNWLERMSPAYKAWRERNSDWLGPDSNGGVTGDGTSDDPTKKSTDTNIGNLKNAGGKGFQSFESKAAGAKAMAHQLMLYQDRDHLDSLSSIINKWAPASDHNDDAAYIKDVSERTGFSANQKLDLHDPKVLSAVEAAMASHEKGVKFSPADIDAMLSSKPKSNNNPKDMTPAARKEYQAVQRGYVSPVSADTQAAWAAPTWASWTTFSVKYRARFSTWTR